MIYILPLKPSLPKLLAIFSLLAVLLGITPAAGVFILALSGKISIAAVVILLAGFPWLVICLLLAHLSMRMRRNHQLVLDQQGLYWQNEGFELKAGWDQVVFQTKAPSQWSVIQLKEAISATPKALPYPMKLNIIPLSCFSELGKLEEAMQAYAPELWNTPPAATSSAADNSQE